MNSDPYRAAHQHRLSWMPWLWDRLKPRQRAWAEPWQVEIQAEIVAVESVTFGDDCFVAPEAHLFAEPGRDVVLGDHCRIGAEVFVHGVVELGRRVTLNPRCHFDGGGGGIVLGDDCRVATGVRIFAWNHGMAPDMLVREQGVASRGVRVGRDVWIGAGAGIVDGVTIGDGAVVGMGAVVTRSVPAGAKVAGSPARVIGWR